MFWSFATHATIVNIQKALITLSMAYYISKKDFHPGRMVGSEWTRAIRPVRGTRVADYFAPGVNLTGHVTNHGLVSLSTGSGLPGFGPGWNWPEGSHPGPGPLRNPTRSVFVGLLPGPDINPRFGGRVEPEPRFHITVPATFAPIKYLSSDPIAIWSLCRLCGFSPSFTSSCQICDRTNIHRIAVK